MFRTVLNNGLTLLVVPNPTVDIVSARFFIRSGSREETKPGLAHLVSSVLTKGTRRRSSMELAHAVESMGAMLGVDSSSDYMQISLKCLSEDFETLIALAAELLQEAIFPEDQFELERKVTLQAIRSQQERPFTVAYNQFRSLLYGAHPYAFTELGTETSVPSLTVDDLKTFYQTYFRANNALAVVVGPITPEAAQTLVERYLGDWTPSEAVPVRPLIEHLSFQPQVLREEQATQQSTVLVGYAAAPVGSADFPALKLISTYLGSGLSSRLFTELREKRGLAYEVSAFYPTRVDLSHFAAYIGTAPENTETCVVSLRAEVERLIEVLLTDRELQTAKNKLIGQYALGKQTNSQVSQLLGWYEALGVGADFDTEYLRVVEQLEAEDLRQIAARTFRDPIVSIVGPVEALAATA